METRNGRSWVFQAFKYTGFAILGILGAIALAFIFGYAVMWLWNWLMPELFGLSVLTFWKAVGLIILARLLFGGFKHGGHPSKHSNPSKRMGRKFMQKGDMWKGSNACYNWKYYDKYWDEEGNEAFEAYIERKKQDEHNK
ncbi:MAG: hypothetical protein JEZ09_20635 [Salinivirgaceae bacterium]|nr:hypothetical protein [Salinivirgaceae bacterium]